ncbi:hypothetical protein [Scytonema hofmannii]|nr:hypothetical protein [Scytonema hofmannii]
MESSNGISPRSPLAQAVPGLSLRRKLYPAYRPTMMQIFAGRHQLAEC